MTFCSLQSPYKMMCTLKRKRFLLEIAELLLLKLYAFLLNISLKVANPWVQRLNHMPVTWQIISRYIFITWIDNNINLINW